MTRIARRRALGLLVAAAALPLTAACPSQPADAEVEDCDLGDRLEGDEDCDEEGKPKPRKSKASTKPKPKRTRRPNRG